MCTKVYYEDILTVSTPPSNISVVFAYICSIDIDGRDNKKERTFPDSFSASFNLRSSFVATESSLDKDAILSSI